MSETPSPRRPTAFRLDDPDVVVAGSREAPAGRIVVEPEPDDVPALPVPPRRRGFRWGRLFWSGVGGLVTLGIGLSVDRLVRDLFAREDWLGWLGLGLAALASVAAVAIIVREVAGIWRLARIDELRADAAAAVLGDDTPKAVKVAEGLVALYRERPQTARGRAAVAGHLGEVIDGRDLMVLVEADLVTPLDRAAQRLVADAAKKVSIVTAISPRAVVDLVFVLVTVLGLIRRLADLYGGRPGTIGFLGLTRHVFAHLAVTGGMAAGDGLVQQILGHGIAARLSTRLGEGVINGLLTARVGLAAIDVCRPMPFVAATRPGIQEVMGGLMPEAEAKTR
ncbi:YcjF family protein [Methylobrevis albus]|uniref:TIGR01620 family protein n=1 Tax=Methylobrevis albus TaxID=2793297 RepID=A0A931I0P7_9HYPH|nr:TIGR01620 family protein [Methylobrevis albus]MBH0236841.1 TIGR01620 family protein [Methylobrevis albus]